MKQLILSGSGSSTDRADDTIYCPAVRGLTETQADLAFVLPRLDHNRAVREATGNFRWAAILASDPFGTEEGLFRELRERGYKGVTNWPSSILLEGTTRQSMSTIPATPESEFAFLARAKAAGFDTMAFFISRDQARLALDSGVRSLVLHPGLVDTLLDESAELFRSSLQSIVDAIRRDNPGVEVLAYSSDFHDREMGLFRLNVDGFVNLKVSHDD